MVEIKTTAILPDEVDYPLIAEFTYNAKKSKFEKMQFTVEKYPKMLQKHFQETVFSYIFRVRMENYLDGYFCIK